MVAHEKLISKQRLRRKRRVRKPLTGTAERPRLAVHRSNKHIYCQLIDDVARKTLCSASTRDKGVELKSTGNIDAASAIGKSIAEKAKSVGIETISFDRGPYKYHGRVKAVAEAAREGGLKF
jgi:large subunit ribosomal protein L18